MADKLLSRSRVAFARQGTKDRPTRDAQTVTEDGKPIQYLIGGVQVRNAITHIDDRGTLCEMFNPAWGFTEEPLVYVYQVTLRPGMVKGWVVHRKQDDRLFFSQGALKVVLYDDREDSSTYQMINELYLGDNRRGLVRIPRGVYHAIQNVGNADALFINMPTRPYCHKNPDKFRLPLDTELIPYRFDGQMGW